MDEIIATLTKLYNNNEYSEFLSKRDEYESQGIDLNMAENIDLYIYGLTSAVCLQTDTNSFEEVLRKAIPCFYDVLISFADKNEQKKDFIINEVKIGIRKIITHMYKQLLIEATSVFEDDPLPYYSKITEFSAAKSKLLLKYSMIYKRHENYNNIITSAFYSRVPFSEISGILIKYKFNAEMSIVNHAMYTHSTGNYTYFNYLDEHIKDQMGHFGPFDSRIDLYITNRIVNWWSFIYEPDLPQFFEAVKEYSLEIISRKERLIPASVTLIKSNINKCLNDFKDNIDTTVKKYKINKYWENHKEEKEELESKKNQLWDKVKKAEKKVQPYKDSKDSLEKEKKELTSAEIRVNELNTEKANLISTKNSLGFFKKKAKAEIDEKLAELEKTIEKTVKTAKKERAEKDLTYDKKIQNVDVDIKKIEDKCDIIYQQISDINTELNKDR